MVATEPSGSLVNRPASGGHQFTIPVNGRLLPGAQWQPVAYAMVPSLLPYVSTQYVLMAVT